MIEWNNQRFVGNSVVGKQPVQFSSEFSEASIVVCFGESVNYSDGTICNVVELSEFCFAKSQEL